MPGFEPPLDALCVAPLGMEEGSEPVVLSHELGVVVGEPVTFRFFCSSVRRDDQVGAFISDVGRENDLIEVSPLEITFPAEGRVAGDVVPVRLRAHVTAIGTLKAFQGVDLSAEVEGIVSAVLFESGQKVTLGQPLIQLDSEVERANLATAEAVRSLARVEFERGRSLVNRQSISKSEFDRLNAELLKAEATVAQLKAQLDKKRVLACACLCEGEYGVEGLYVGVPCVIGAGGLERIIELELNAEEKKEFDASVEHVRTLISQIQL